jgi:hypothetical protein
MMFQPKLKKEEMPKIEMEIDYNKLADAIASKLEKERQLMESSSKLIQSFIEKIEKEKQEAEKKKEEIKKEVEVPKPKALVIDKATRSVPCPDCDSVLIHVPKSIEKRAACPGCGTVIDIDAECCPLCGCNYGFKKPKIDKAYFGKKK